MNRRKLLQGSAALAGTGALSRLTLAQGAALNDHAAIPRTNWSKNFHFHTDRVYAPTTREEVQQIVRQNPKLKGLGSRHSFNDSADSHHAQISMRAVKSVQIDAAAKTATVGAGVAYGELAPVLDQAGFALHNLASLPHISVGGTIATATHGSGVHNQNLSSSVRALEIVTADGNVIHLSRDHDGDTFKTAVVHVGGLGIITGVTLDLLPRFDMTQVVYEDLSFDQLQHNMDAILGAAYSVSLFTTWQNNRATQVWLKQKVQPGVTPPAYEALPKEFYGATLQKAKLHPLREMPAQNCTEQMGSVGPWYARLPHFKMEFTPSSGEELQSEFFVAREHGYEAIRAVETLKDKITPHLLITELRTIAADDMPMSMHYKRDSLAIHFTWKPQEPEVRALLPEIEAKLAPFQARPHWGKIFTMDPKVLDSRYPEMQRYRDLAAKLDPQGKFRNDFLNRNVFAG
ncbi:FAD-binding protein [Terriglobus aquaticus]|uniref:FAD-binding protein n=1 Tax=Terriglobus aquaticus TaxID=940139 RepID=A0ABW9KLV6_9BACT|nr:FAD-binding protein [Terriglobus aquaticus]